LHGVLERVLTKIPHDLPQLARVRAHFDIGWGAARAQPLARPLHRVAELLLEFLGPGLQRQTLLARLLPLREAEHVVDDAAHAIGVGTDDLRQAPILARSEEHTSELQSLAYLV